MRRLRICAFVALLLQAGGAMAADTPVAEIAQLRMYSSFWQNLHHFLYVSAWASRSVSPGSRILAMPLPPGSNVSMTPDEKGRWDHAVAVYERDLASNELLVDFGMIRSKLGLVGRGDEHTGSALG